MFKNTALMAAYETVYHLPETQRVTVWQRDKECYVLKRGVSDERLRAVFLKALRAIGCTEREFKKLNASSYSMFAERMRERKNIEQSRPNQERGR